LSEWEKLIPEPRTYFITVKCKKCENEQMMFSHPTRKILCNSCGELLAKPSGGKAKITGQIVSSQN
jgi:small subunit ribosomal protein S27e